MRGAIVKILVLVVAFVIARSAHEDWKANAEISRMWIQGSRTSEVLALGRHPTMRAAYFYACHLYTHVTKNDEISNEHKAIFWYKAKSVFANIVEIAPKYEKAAENLQIMEDAENAQR
jgi:hypothetical protein